MEERLEFMSNEGKWKLLVVVLGILMAVAVSGCATYPGHSGYGDAPDRSWGSGGSGSCH